MVDFMKERFHRISKYYKKKSIQYMISISFTMVALVGMIFMGLALYLRFIDSTEKMIK